MMEEATTFYLTQGVLGVSVLMLIAVVVYLQRKIDRKDTDHAAEVKALNALILQTVQTHAKDYQEMARNEQEVLSDVSQSVTLFGAKIEVAKERAR